MTGKSIDSIEDVSDWLCQLGYERFVERFVEYEIDGEVLPELDINDLTTMQIPMGPAKKILKAIAEVCSNGSTDPSPHQPLPYRRLERLRALCYQMLKASGDRHVLRYGGLYCTLRAV